MALRLCLGFGGERCGKLTSASRCQAHTRAKEAARPRPNSRQRGYDAEHERTRRQLLPLAIGKPCPRCGRPMLQGQALDLGHTVPLRIDPNSRGDRIEHATCNRGERGNAA